MPRAPNAANLKQFEKGLRTKVDMREAANLEPEFFVRVLNELKSNS